MAPDRQPIKHALLTVPFAEEYLSQIRKALEPATITSTSSDDGDGIAQALQSADVAIIEGDLDHRYVAAPKLAWVHCDHSGLTRSALPEVFARGLLVSGSAGRSAQALAQHVMFFALSLTFDGYGLHDEQRAHSWRGLPGYGARLSLWGKTLGVIGLGHTGMEVAKLGAAFGMRVLGYRRQDIATPEHIQRVYSADHGDSLDELLSRSDVVVVAAHLSDQTYHLISEHQLDIMKTSAYLINIARGAVVDEPALAAALHGGLIAGAASDVFETEPLPPDSPLWDTPNFLVTPHATPSMPDKTQRSVEMMVENIRRYRLGEPLLNPLKPQDLFTPR